jgi:peptidoglycan L-alanyl-D-glutamate endopeptidase CwlK
MITSRSTADLSPQTQKKADELVSLCAGTGIDLLIISTYRDLEAQAALYAQGRTTKGRIVTNARPGMSYHNWRVAFDAIAIINGKALWRVRNDDRTLTTQWRAVVDLAKGIGLETGADWSSITDDDHFQFTESITLAQFQSGTAAA